MIAAMTIQCFASVLYHLSTTMPTQVTGYKTYDDSVAAMIVSFDRHSSTQSRRHTFRVVQAIQNEKPSDLMILDSYSVATKREEAALTEKIEDVLLVNDRLFILSNHSHLMTARSYRVSFDDRTSEKGNGTVLAYQRETGPPQYADRILGGNLRLIDGGKYVAADVYVQLDQSKLKVETWRYIYIDEIDDFIPDIRTEKLVGAVLFDERRSYFKPPR
jgi:hypothetical protein